MLFWRRPERTGEPEPEARKRSRSSAVRKAPQEPRSRAETKGRIGEPERNKNRLQRLIAAKEFAGKPGPPRALRKTPHPALENYRIVRRAEPWTQPPAILRALIDTKLTQWV